MKGYIYKYIFPDGKVYIGQTVRPLAARHREHITPSTGKVNTGFWEAWQKYGDAKQEVVEVIETNAETLSEKLNSYERGLIEQYRATDPQYGYNRIPGGHAISSSQKKLGMASRKLFTELWSERALFYETLEDKILHSSTFPISLDEEEASFIRESVIPGIPTEFIEYIELSDDGKLSFIEGDDGSEELLSEEAFEWLLYSINELSQVESEELSRIVDSYVLSNSEAILSNGIIQQIDQDGTVVKEFASIADIMHELNLSYSTNIYNVLHGKQKTAYGYIWRWKTSNH